MSVLLNSLLLGRLELLDAPSIPAKFVPKYQDVVQGRINACYVAAVIASLAYTRVKAIQRMMGPARQAYVVSKRGSDQILHWTKYLYDVKFPGNPKAIRISGRFYHTSNDGLAYAGTPDGAGWPSFLEKAYAVWRGGNSYQRLDDNSAPTLNTVVNDLIGKYDFGDLTKNRLITHTGGERTLGDAGLVRLLSSAPQRPTVAASLDLNVPDPIVADHGYAVLNQR